MFKKLLIFIMIGIAAMALFEVDRRKRAEENKNILARCTAYNKTFSGDNGEDPDNCQCMINSFDAERSYMDYFITRPKSPTAYHYLNCSKNRYMSKMLGAGTELGNLIVEEEQKKNPNFDKIFDVQKFAQCYADTMYNHDFADLQNFSTEGRDDIGVKTMVSCADKQLKQQ